MVTINNPDQLDQSVYSFENLKKYVAEKVKADYFCLSFERGLETHVLHCHIYLYFKNARLGSTIKNKFDKTAHIDCRNKTNKQNRDYVFKENLTEENKAKEDTRLEGMQYENCSVDEFEEKFIEKQGKRNDLSLLYDYIKQGLSNVEIYTLNPSFLKFSYMIDKVRTEYLEETYRKERRELEVVYVNGTTGTGKTRGIMDAFGYDKVYRVTDYKHPFDSYKQEDIIIFEEFRSSLAIEQMLNFLDCYPVALPARYCNKVACYHKVFICTNWDLEEQYAEIQEKYPATWAAFLRRINSVKVYNSSTDIEEYNSVEEYLHRNDIKDVFNISDSNEVAEIDLFAFLDDKKEDK